MITNFELISQFKPFYKAGKSFYATSDNYVIADDGENINYINCENFHLIKTLNEEKETITCFVSNPNDSTVIMANSDLMLIKIDRSKTGKCREIWKSVHSAPIFAMSLDNTSTRLTTGGAGGRVCISHIGDKEGKNYTCTHHTSKINIIKNHPSRNMVVTVSMLEHEIVAWSTDNGRKMGIFEGHQNMITAVDFHETQDLMVSSSRDTTVMVWNCTTFARQCLIPLSEAVESCIILRDLTGDDIRLMIGGERGIIATVSVNKRCIVQEFSKSSIFSNAIQGEMGSQESLKSIRNIVALSDGGIVVCRESDNIEFYTEKMALKYELSGELSTIKEVVMMGENNDYLLAVESAPYMRLFDCAHFFTEEGSKCTQWPSQLVAGGHSIEITAVSVFDNGRMLASGDKEGLVCIWRLDHNDPRVRLKVVASLAYPKTSLDPKEDKVCVSSICADKTGSCIYVNYVLKEFLVVLSFDGKLLTKLCDVYKPHTDFVSCMDVNVNGSLMATGSKDKTAKIWCYDRKKNDLVNRGTFKGHKRGIWSVKFSEFEQLFLTASVDKCIRLWSLDNFESVVEIQSESIVYKALFSKDEKQIIACNKKGEVTVWNIDKKKSSATVEVHDSAILAMNLLHDKDGNVTGFVAAGDNSMICLYKDVSAKQIEETKKTKEGDLQFQQELNNLLSQQQFSAAFKLSVKLRKPIDAYNILREIKLSANTPDTPVTPYSQDSLLANVFKTLNKAELITLLQFANQWIRNKRTYRIGNEAFIYLLCSVPNKELVENEDFAKRANDNQYNQRASYLQNDEFLSQTGLLSYLRGVSGVKELEGFRMDTE